MMVKPDVENGAADRAELRGWYAWCFGSDDPAVDADGLAIDPAAVRASEEGDGGGDVFGLAQPFEPSD
jgi:hypothetical protein